MEPGPDSSSLRNEKGQFRFRLVPSVKPWTYRHNLMPTGTYCGRVVHRRKPHAFTAKDIRRLVEKYGDQVQTDYELPWLWDLIDRVAMWILGKVIGEDAAVVWYGFQSVQTRVINNLFPGDTMLQDANEEWTRRFLVASKDPKALERLLEALRKL